MYNQINISGGHSVNCQGASDIINEVTEAKKVVDRVYEIIKASGKACYKYYDTASSSSQNLANIVNWHNQYKDGVDVSVHFNAYSHVDKAMGVEVCYYNNSTLASQVSSAIANAGGFINRGAKQRTNLYFLKNTKKPAILIEVCFVDSVKDVELYKANFENICQAIAKSLIGEIKINQSAPQPTANKVSYEAHVQNVGWQGVKHDGQTAGTVGESKRIEALRINCDGIKFKGHVQNMGWTSERVSGEIIGTAGEDLRLEAVQLFKNGIKYRVHIQNKGWTNWFNSGEVAGTVGESLRIEAIEIKLN